MLWGLFQAPRATSPPAPVAAGWGVPARPIRVASLNVRRLQRGIDQVTSELRTLDADFVLLQEIDSRDVVGLARALGMQQFHHPKAYERSGNLGGPKATWGNVIFAKHPMYDAGLIPNPGGESFGVWATSIVNDKKFIIANIHLSAKVSEGPSNAGTGNGSTEIANLTGAWVALGRPPILVGGDFDQIQVGADDSMVTRDFVDVLDSQGEADMTSRSSPLNPLTQRLLASRNWTATHAGVIASEPSDHPLIWASLVRADDIPATATRPATSEAP